jgi:hypothetical protein
MERQAQRLRARFSPTRKLREDQEAVGLPQYKYDYKIEIVLPEDFSK